MICDDCEKPKATSDDDQSHQREYEERGRDCPAQHDAGDNCWCEALCWGDWGGNCDPAPVEDFRAQRDAARAAARRLLAALHGHA
ncbi:MAG: hypothetical protein KDB73_19875, partial [Planctomycetes bacterium]|nr:hypothetical protein [Planctomycetota bacterium]